MPGLLPTTRPVRWGVTLLLVLVSCVGLTACGGGGTNAAGPVTTAGRASSTQAAVAASPPAWVDIPSISARSSLIQLGLNPDKSIQVPPVDQPQQAGWYSYGPKPGENGPAVILGHIDGNHQQGIFWRLHEVKPGDTVTVGQQSGKTLTFTVTKVDDVAKSAFPTSAVYGNTPNPQLRLITCGGAFDATTGHYLDNFIVYATMTS
jgi:LPXTG-site transpeptidase (sortase) family protein